MRHELVAISTKDGSCPAYVFASALDGRSPAIIFFMDAGGIRPAALAMAERLASAGYTVLLPDLFYRFGPYGPFDVPKVLASDFRATLGPLMATTGNAKTAEDIDAFVTYLDARPDVQTGRVGAVGFCMGGGMAIAAAGTRPDRIAAVACFHGGNLATDAVDSPHTYATRLDAQLYFGVAEDDESYPPAMAERFEGALRAAGVAYLSETYPAAHGWMMPDFPVYDANAAEHGWREMLSFFARTLPRNG